MKKNNVQDDLFRIKPLENKENVTMPLARLMQVFAAKELQKPEFQRDYCWPNEKLTGWARTIMSGDAIGVFVTYQLYSGGMLWLADGLQRLTAAQLFVDSPRAYGFDFGSAQATDFCWSLGVTRQHRHYEDHQEAMTAFQNLNKGTSLTPSEFFKGVLTLDTRGKVVHDSIPIIVESYTKRLMAQKASGRKAGSRLLRDCYALFFQYISETNVMTFWNVGSSKLTDYKRSLEHQLVGYLKNRNISVKELEEKIMSFGRFVATQVAEIDEMAQSIDKNKAFSPTLIRWLLHLAIWRKNTNRPVTLYKEFVLRLLAELAPFFRFSTRVVLFDSDREPTENVTLSVGDLSCLAKLCNHWKVSLYDGQGKRSGKKMARVGYQESHTKPFSVFGDGETFIEPGSTNMARGAESVDKDEDKWQLGASA